MKPQEALQYAKTQYDKQLELQAIWEKAVRDDPANQQKVDQLAYVKSMVAASKAHFDQAQKAASLAADPTSKQAQAELKRLEKINKQGAELTESITQTAQALNDQMVEWQELRKESKRLADRYDLNPFDLGIAGSRLDSLQLAVKRWLQELRSWERRKEINSQPKSRIALPNAKKNLIPNERDRMLAERYPKAR